MARSATRGGHETRFPSFPPLLTSYKVNETTSERALKDSAGERVVEPARMPRHTHRVGGPAQRSGAAAGAPAAAAGSCLIIEPCSLALWHVLRQFCAHRLAQASEAVPVHVAGAPSGAAAPAARIRKPHRFRYACPAHAAPHRRPVSSPCLARADRGL
eukprot:scaffold31967_cov66-Phaeocystis_antarctica.AAC.9